MSLSARLLCLAFASACTTSTPEPAATSWHGTATSGFEQCSFRACNETQDWWMARETTAVSQVCNSSSAGPVGKAFAVRIAGTLSAEGHFGHLNQYSRLVTVTSLVVLPEAEAACP